MTTLRRLLFGVFALLCFGVVAAPKNVVAAVAVESLLASGKIAQIQEQGAVRFDDGRFFRPARNGKIVDLTEGESVTLRYYVDASGEKVYFEFSPGLNSLSSSGSMDTRKKEEVK